LTGREILKITINLIAIYLIGGTILAVVYAKTSPIMYRNAVLEKEKALKLLMPDAIASGKQVNGRFMTNMQSIMLRQKVTLSSGTLSSHMVKAIRATSIRLLRLIQILKSGRSLYSDMQKPPGSGMKSKQRHSGTSCRQGLRTPQSPETRDNGRDTGYFRCNDFEQGCY